MRHLRPLCIVLLLVLSGCASVHGKGSGDKLSARQLKDMGEKYMAAGDTGNALKYLTEAEQKRPDDPMIKFDLGLAYNQRGLQDQAILHLQQALKLKPAYPEALNALGAVYADRGQIELAQEAFQKALNDPFYQTPQYAAFNLGKLYENKGDQERALNMYQQAVHLDPSYGLAWYRMGTILEALRRGDEARNAYGKAVSTAPDLAEAHLRYGVMSYQTGNMEAALLSLTRVVKLVPNTAMADEARVYLGKLKGLTQTELGTGASGTDIDVISNQELQRQQTQQRSSLSRPAARAQTAPSINGPAPYVKMTPIPAPAESESPSASAEPVVPAAKEPPAPAAPAISYGEGTGQSPFVSEQQFNYIVQLGSFVDKEKAEELRNHLREKGYNAIVKPLKHDVLGKVFVIQLKPVDSRSKAATLKAQLAVEVEGEPVILRIPVASKPVDLTPPADNANPTPAPAAAE
jgi:tetratricopeptide (TPR) repeat protein